MFEIFKIKCWEKTFSGTCSVLSLNVHGTDRNVDPDGRFCVDAAALLSVPRALPRRWVWGRSDLGGRWSSRAPCAPAATASSFVPAAVCVQMLPCSSLMHKRGLLGYPSFLL